MNVFIKISTAVVLLVSFTSCATQIKNTKTETVKIYGNCGMCEKTIETAAAVKGTAKADWNKDTKLAQITFDGSKTNSDEVLKRIALAGYDSDKFNAPDEVYAKLPSCCQYERPKNAVVPTEVAEKTAPETPISVTETAPKPAVEVVAEPKPKVEAVKNEPNPAELKQQLGEVLNAYYAVKNALVDDDGKTASTKATELLSALGKVNMANFSKSQHDIYMPLAEKIRFDAEHISDTKDVSHQRDHFNTLSDHVFTVVKTFEVNAEPAYQQFCPMARDGKGAYWISKEKVVKNPYYGKSMLTCGKVTETLK